MKNITTLIYIALGFILFSILVILTALRHLPVFWDEAYYLENITLLNKYGFTNEYLINYKGPAGPTYAFIHYLFQPITHLKAPLVRMVNIILLGITNLIIYKTFQLLNNSKHLNIALALSVFAFSTLYTITGMALTEIPAILFLTITVFYTVRQYLSNEFNIIQAIISGLSFSLAILGRQPIIALLGAFPFFFFSIVKPYKIKIQNKRFIYYIIITFVISLIIPFYIFYIWGNIQPISMEVTGIGLAPNHLILSLGYAAIFTFLIYPHFYSFKYISFKEIIIVTTIAIVSNFILLKVEFTPFLSLARKYLSPTTLYVYSLACGSILAILGILFTFYFLKKQFKTANTLIFVLSIGFLLIISTSIKVTHQFSARYVAQAFPLLVIAINYDRKKITYLDIITLLIGGTLGIISLESYF